jgi:hypothetical protein
MTVITTINHAVKKRSNKRPRSLILHIPAQVRDLMEWEHNTNITIDVCIENEKKILKIYTTD